MRPGNGSVDGRFASGIWQILYFRKIAAKNKNMHCRASSSPKQRLLPAIAHINHIQFAVGLFENLPSPKLSTRSEDISFPSLFMNRSGRNTYGSPQYSSSK